MLLNIEEPKKDIELPESKTLADAAILSKLGSLFLSVSSLIETHKYSAAGEELRDFTWNELADKYLEIAKIEKDKSEILNFILNALLKFWHPFMPFVTESIWQSIYGETEMLIGESWPEIISSRDILEGYDSYIHFDSYDSDIDTLWNYLWDVITSVRSLRSEKGIAPSVKLPGYIITSEYQVLFEKNKAIIEELSRLESLSIVSKLEKTNSMASMVVGMSEVCIDFGGSIDVSAEKKRLEKEIANVAPYVAAQEKKLSGDFAKNAPAAIVEKEREKLVEAKAKLKNLQEKLGSL
jgi:valyl-tRNA synthetase